MSQSVTCILPVNGSGIAQAFHRDYFTEDNKVEQDIWDFAIAVHPAEENVLVDSVNKV